MEHIYNMKNQFWAVGCGLGWTMKKKMFLADYEQPRIYKERIDGDSYYTM